VEPGIRVDAEARALKHGIVGALRWRVLATEDLYQDVIVVLGIVEALNLQQDRHRPVLDRTADHAVDELPLPKATEHVLPVFANVFVVDDAKEIVVDAWFSVGPHEVVVCTLCRAGRVHARDAVVEVETIDAHLRVVRIMEAKRRRDEAEAGQDGRNARASVAIAARTAGGATRDLLAATTEQR
jgi:hypothetical protein